MANIKNYNIPLRDFPPIIDGRINVKKFLLVVTDVIAIFDQFGIIFIPVKVSLQRNIDKINKVYNCEDNSCLLEQMLEEKSRGEQIGIEACLWLNRSIFLLELFIEQLLTNIKANIQPEDMDALEMFTKAYDEAIREHHNLVTQQLFGFICKMFPTLTQMLNAVGMIENLEVYVESLERFNKSLYLVRIKIDDFCKTNELDNLQTKPT